MKRSILFRIACDPIVRIGSFVTPRRIPADIVETAPALYLGGGALVSLPDIDMVLNGTASRYEVTVSGVSVETLALAREDAPTVKGAKCHVGQVFFDDDWQMTEVEWLAVLRADTIATAHRTTSRSITLSLGTDFTDRSKAPVAFFTDADQRRRSPTDKFFDHIAMISQGVTRRFGPND